MSAPIESSAVTSAQNAVTYFPEFQYERFWRLLERMNGGYDMTHEFKKNGYSTYERRTHFTPIWYRMEAIRRIHGCWIAGHRLGCFP